MPTSKYQGWVAGVVVLLLQCADLSTTWAGIHMPGVHEIDGTSFGTLLVAKLAITVGCVGLCWMTPKAAWVVTGAMAVVLVPVIASNIKLILG